MSIGLSGHRTGFGMRLIATTLACAMVGAPALAASRATLGGKIVNAAGAPVSGAKVLVLRPGSDSVLFSATTAPNGLYAIEGVEVGTYHVRVESTTELRGDTVKAEVTDKGLVVNWRLAANQQAAALAVPGKVGGAEDDLCSPVTIGEYEVNRCYLAGGVLLAGLGIGLGVGLSGGGGGGGPALTPTIIGGFTATPSKTRTTVGGSPTPTKTGGGGGTPTPTNTGGGGGTPTPTNTGGGGGTPTATLTNVPTATLTTVPTPTATTGGGTPTLTPVPPTVGPTATPTCETCNR